MQSAEDGKHTNLCANNWRDIDEDTPESSHKRIICSNADDAAMHGEQHGPMAIVDVEDLIGTHFNLPANDGKPRDDEMVEATLDHADGVNNDSTLTKFCCRINNNDACQEMIECDQVMDCIESSNDQLVFWELKRMIAHQEPLPPAHPSHNGSPHNVTAKWENGETTDEPLAIIALDAPVACAILC